MRTDFPLITDDETGKIVGFLTTTDEMEAKLKAGATFHIRPVIENERGYTQLVYLKTTEEEKNNE